MNDVLSVSREKGVCKQIELLGRSFAGSDLSNYHVLKNMEIVYTKSPLAKNPYGIIQANRINSGIVSTMYAVYYVKEYNSPLFIEHYFSLDSRLNNYLKPLVNIGAKHDMKIKNSDVLKGKIYYPSYTEQCKISYLFEILNKKINVLESKIKTLKKYRKGIIHHLIKKGFLSSKIKDLVRVEKKTGLASSYGKDIGPYPFFINNDEGIEKYCDEYIFNGQYLIINTGGTASFKYYDGKFSAMSDCLILRPIAHAIGLYYFLVANEKRINITGFQGTGLKHLDQKWFFNLKVILPNLSDAELNKLNELTESQIENLKKKVKLMKSFKQYLLANMFI